MHEKRRQGQSIVDLTESNPTKAGLSYPRETILAALGDPRSLNYEPTPWGLEASRQAIANYYQDRVQPQNSLIGPDDLLLTSSTSEAYANLFKLLANPGDVILSPQPSYPLFDFLAAAESVEIRPYLLTYDAGWRIDLEELAVRITPQTRAVVVVNPNNPTGSFLSRLECAQLLGICRRHDLALICDEVFFDYRLRDGFEPFDPAARSGMELPVLTFLLNGLSKLVGLPQMKLGWMAILGPDRERMEARERLEILADTFLSVNTPVQHAVPTLLRDRRTIQDQIQSRLRQNLDTAGRVLSGSPAEVLRCEGGWCAVLRLPQVHSGEQWALLLLRDYHVLTHPGYLFDFQAESFLVVSLLTPAADFQTGVECLRKAVDRL